MPSRNVLKIDVSDHYYHVYARGSSRQEIFLSSEDYEYFLQLFRRYLSAEKIVDGAGKPYVKLFDDIEMLAYCLMRNHFHLLIYQHKEGSMQRLMRGVMTGYSRYFNHRYQRSGPLFESRYKASIVTSDSYLRHISRYIHLNPKSWQGYSHSSLPYYRDGITSDWLRPHRMLELFPSREAYVEFLADYESRRDILEGVKHELAGY